MKRKRPRVSGADSRQVPPDLLDAISRRTFVKTSSGLLVAAGLGCNPDLNSTIAGVFPTGTLSLKVNGLPGGLPDAGTATLTRTDVAGKPPLIVKLPASGSVQTQVVTGSFRAVYTPPSGYQVVGANVFDMVVTADTVSSLSINVIALIAQGTLRIVVTGLTAAPVDGGTASILRTDVTGQSPITVPVPKATGQVDTAVAAGSYTVTYTPPIGFTLNALVSNPQNLTVAAGAIAQTSFGLTAPAGFVAPNILNNASFETGYDGFTDGSRNTPTNPTRDATQAYSGIYALRKVLPVTTGIGDVGSAASFDLTGGGLTVGYNRLWARFYFYFDAAIDGILKFQLWFDPPLNIQFAGFYTYQGYIYWSFASGSAGAKLAPIRSLVNGWHSLEVDNFRVGDTGGNVLTTGDGEPSAAIWLDGVPLTSANTFGFSGAGPYWKGERVYHGSRPNSARLGWYELLGLLNGGIAAPSNANTVPGDVWVDRVAISSLGRIGA